MVLESGTPGLGLKARGQRTVKVSLYLFIVIVLSSKKVDTNSHELQ
jgi:hypothetical protein